MAHIREELTLGTISGFRGQLCCCQFLLGTEALGHITEAPNPSKAAGTKLQRLRMPLESPSVLQMNDFVGLQIRAADKSRCATSRALGGQDLIRKQMIEEQLAGEGTGIYFTDLE